MDVPLIGAGISHELLVGKSEVGGYKLLKIQAVARLAGVELTQTPSSDEELQAASPLERQLVLRITFPTKDPVCIVQANAIVRYLAELAPAACLYGRTAFNEAEVDQWLEGNWHEYETPFGAMVQDAKNGQVVARAKKHIKDWLAALDAVLASRTFLVGDGHRVTIADIALCASHGPCLGDTGGSGKGKQWLSGGDLAAIPHVMRWHKTVTAQFLSTNGHGQAKGSKSKSKGKGKAAGAGVAKAKGAAAGAAAGKGGGKKSAKGAKPCTSSTAETKSRTTGVSLPGNAFEVSGSAEAGTFVSSSFIKQYAEPPQLPPAKFRRKRIRVKELLGKGKVMVGQKVVVMGWLRSVREAEKGALLFLALQDGSCDEVLQCLASKGHAQGFEEATRTGGAGASLKIQGTVVESPAKGQEIEVKADVVEVLGAVHAGEDGEVGGKFYPLAKKHHTREHLRSIGHLRPRSRLGSAVSRIRHAMAYATNKFFNDRGFLYVHTPLITGADCEGAGEQFVVTTVLGEDGQVQAKAKTKEGNIDYAQDFFGKRTCLTVSGQLNVETHCCALSDVYTFGPTFRAEHSNTARHLAEFWMIEPEIAFAELEDDMCLAEDYIKYLTAYALEHCDDDLRLFEGIPSGEKELRKRLVNVLESDFIRLPYTKAVEVLQDHIAKKKVKFESYPNWGDDLGSEHERYITEKVYKQPVIVIDYPKDIKAFYMKLNPDGKTVAAMDILVPRIGEIIGGSQREEQLDVLEQRAKETGLGVDAISWYLDLRRYGTMKHAGFGLGFERLVMFVTGLDNIKDTIPFPRSYGSACEY